MKTAWIFFFLLYAFYFFHHYPELPQKFATHWDASGQPNGWSLKESFRNQFFFFTVFINLIFLALSYFINVIPESMINWPDKAWWFATPERKKAAFARITTIFSLTGLYLNLVFLFCVHVIFQEAQVPVALQIPVNAGGLLILGLAVGLIAACLYLTFRKPEIT